MAHAAAGGGRGAGNKANDGLAAFIARQKLGGVDFALAADFADHDDRFRFGVGEEHFEDLDEVEAFYRVAADADTAGLAEAGGGGLGDGLVGEGSTAGDDADLAAAVDVAGHDADLAGVGCDHAGAVGADQDRFGTG